MGLITLSGPTSSLVDVLLQPFLAAKVAQLASASGQEEHVELRPCGTTGVQPVVEGDHRMRGGEGEEGWG